MMIQPLRTDGRIDDIIDQYKNMVYGIALTRVRNQSDADDVFQEVFLAYYRKSPVFHEEDHRKAWLIKATINCSKKLLSNIWRKRAEPLDTITDYVLEFSSDTENEIYSSLCELPEKYRTVLHLYYFEDMSVDEISRVLNVRAGTVRMQMTRGRELLRNMLKGDYFNE